MRGFRRLWILLVLALVGFASAQKVSVTFTYDPPATLEVRSVSLRGSFNNWGETPMQKQESGAWAVTVELDPGPVQYKFFINGQWPKNMCDDETYGTPQVDAEAQGCTDDGQGGQNAVREIRAQTGGGDSSGGLALEHDPTKPLYVSEAWGRLSIRFQVPADAVKAAVLQADQEYPMHRQLLSPDGETWRVSVPTTVSEYRIKVTGSDDTEQTFGPYTAPAERFRALDWVGNRVGYQIFPDRFSNGDPSNDAKALETSQAVFDKTWTGQPPYLSRWTDPPGPYHCCQQYFGGDLAGVLERLPHLERLGVTLIYFNPLFDSGSAHGYDTHDYTKVSPKFGDNALMRRVLEEAHRRGIRVIFDFVPNHTGIGFWAFQDVVRRGPNSPYWNWYSIKKWPFTPGDGNAYTGWANLGSLPKLNTANPGVRRYLIEVSKYWLRFGFDGIRVDVANEVAGGFFPEWRRAVRSVKPDAYLIGEIWDRAPSWVQGDQFDSLMNYTLGRGGSPPAVGGALGFARGGPLQNGGRILGEIARVYASYPEAVAAMGFNLIDSHDTPRTLSDLGGGGLRDTPSPESLARLKLASAILYALPGSPVTFQGDECGFTGERGEWPVNELYRYPIQWDKCNGDVLAHYQRLGKLRRELEPLASPVFRTYFGQGPLMAFLRGEPGVGELLAVFNNSTEAANLELPQGSWRDAVDGQTYTGQVSLPAIGWRYLVRTGQ